MLPESLTQIRSLTFDLMGTCADWHSTIVKLLLSLSPIESLDVSELAKAWRFGFFQEIFDSFDRGEQSPDIDIVHRKVLDRLLHERGISKEIWGDDIREELVNGWHYQLAWPDAVEGVSLLKEKLDVVVLANGTTRLQLDIVSSSGLPFHTLFSSQLLGHTKPDPEIYKACLRLLDRRPEEVAMVAAHAYDLRAAQNVGMRTIYIQRDTEDPNEDMDQIKSEVDLFIDGRMSVGDQGGLVKLARLLLDGTNGVY